MSETLPETIPEKIDEFNEMADNARRCIDLITEGPEHVYGRHWNDKKEADFSARGTTFYFLTNQGGVRGVVFGAFDCAETIIEAMRRERQVLLERIADLEKKWKLPPEEQEKS